VAVRPDEGIPTREVCVMKPEIYRFSPYVRLSLPLFTARIHAGFPSPAEDYIEKSLDLNEYLVQHPAATFFVRVTGDSMTGAGINSGDLLIVDRALKAVNGSVIVAILNGEFTVKRLQSSGKRVRLFPENPAYQPIEVTAGCDFEVWGVVVHVIHTVRRS